MILRFLTSLHGHVLSFGVRRTGRRTSETLELWEFARGATNALSQESEVSYGLRTFIGERPGEASLVAIQGILVSVGLSSRTFGGSTL